MYKQQLLLQCNNDQDLLKFADSNSILDEEFLKLADSKYNNFNRELINTLYIFTDGSCIDNGQKSAKARYGIFIPNNLHCESVEVRPHNYIIAGGELTCDESTYTQPSNNRGELLALISALKYIKNKNITTNVVIVTDSGYGVRTLTIFYPMRLKAKTEDALKNTDLLSIAHELLIELKNVRIQHMHSHKKMPNIREDAFSYFLWYGNNFVDKMIKIN